jgi:hypothetical protein
VTHSGGRPHTNIGDRGQRFEVRATGYPKEEESIVGWSPTVEGAAAMADAIGKAPGCTSTMIFDRVTGEPVITRFRGVLR